MGVHDDASSCYDDVGFDASCPLDGTLPYDHLQYPGGECVCDFTTRSLIAHNIYLIFLLILHYCSGTTYFHWGIRSIFNSKDDINDHTSKQNI